MKKSLIAMAVLASSGAVMAQSSVTLYGLVDAAVAYQSVTNTTYVGTVGTSVKTSQGRIDSSGANNSRWGLRGTEDLGNGLKANFVLESGFNTDDGTAAGAQFGRQAFVGLSGDFGAVTLGRQYTAHFGLFTATNNLYDTNLATTTSALTGSVWGNGVAAASNRASNSIAYTSPVYSGFSGAVVYGLGEDKNAIVPPAVTPSNRKAAYNGSLHLKYANGPLLVGYAYQNETNAATVALGARAKNEYHLLGASYDFGVAKLTGSYSNAKSTQYLTANTRATTKDDEYQIGVSAPFGAATVAAGYSYSKSKVAGFDNGKAHGLSLLGTYSLSKRTTLYAGVAGTNFKNGAGNTTTKTTTAAAGVRHSF